MAISLRNTKKIFSNKPRLNSVILLFEYYYNFLDIFFCADSDKLAEY